MLKNILIQQVNFLKTSLTLQQQLRTTFILKRKYEPLLNKTNKKPKKLRAKYFIYELVEDTSVKKRENLEVILKTFVDGVGDKGDIVSVKPNYAYNKLLLPGLAAYKTPENIAKYAKTEDDKVMPVHSSPNASRTMNKLSQLCLAVVMNKDVPWVIEPWHIKMSLRKAGYYCNDDCITLPKEPIVGPDLLKQGKEFYCTITINNLEKVELKCRLHHWSTDPSNRLPYVFEHWKMPAEPLIVNSSEEVPTVATTADVKTKNIDNEKKS